MLKNKDRKVPQSTLKITEILVQRPYEFFVNMWVEIQEARK